MSTTQEHLLISDIKDNILLLKDGGGALVMQVSAVNFGLLSEREQIGIIASFAQMLNSLSFAIQIVIQSERLNISSYLNLLDHAQKAQTNPLLSAMMTSYRQFIQTTIKENEVLDKKFYVVIPLSKLELGIIPTREALYQKVKTVLLPRRDQVIRQLNRVGLKATQLQSKELLELFYNAYNGSGEEFTPLPQPVKLNAPKPIVSTPTPPPAVQEKPAINNPPPLSSQIVKTHPFVVEELEDAI
ncbi:hypothetical protein HYZ06_01000 [Candidatus Daviesbacteria bacterium]|nr:hypothetical protein [Candidatus Daviesbacteria bacterium]